MILATFAKNAVTKAIWAALPLGTWVYSHNMAGLAQVVERDISQKTGKWRLWLRARGITTAIDPLDVSTIVNSY